MLNRKSMGQRIGISFIRLYQGVIDFFVDLFPIYLLLIISILIAMIFYYIYRDSVAGVGAFTGVNAFVLIVSAFSLFIAFISFLISWTSFAKKIGHKIVACYNQESSLCDPQISGIPYIDYLCLYNKRDRTEVIKRIFIRIPNGRSLELINFQDEPLILSSFAKEKIPLKIVTAYAENLISKDISNVIFLDPSNNINLVIEKISDSSNPTFYHIENRDQDETISKEELVKKKSIFSNKRLEVIIRTDETFIFADRLKSDGKHDALMPFHNDYEFKDYYKNKSFDNNIFRAYNFIFSDGAKLDFTFDIFGVLVFEYHSEEYNKLVSYQYDEFKKHLDLDKNKNIKNDFLINVDKIKKTIFPTRYKLNDEQINFTAQKSCYLDFHLKILREKSIVKKNIKQFNSSFYETKNLQEYLQKSNKKS